MEIVSNIRVPAVLRREGSNDTSEDCIRLDRDEFFIGRAKESNFCIPEGGLYVSRNHAVIRWNGGQWSIKSLGQNGVVINRVVLPRNQQMAIQHMDIINFSSGDKYLYTFRVDESDSSEVGEEPVAKKRRIPLANRNYPSLKDDATPKIRVPAVLRRTGSSDTSEDFYDCIPLDRDEFFIGRAQESNFCIPADGHRVSRKHAVISRNGGQWSIKSLGKKGVAVNKVELPRNQQMAIQHMDIINFSSGDNYVYTFRVQSDSSEVGEDEPCAKKRRIPLANLNCPSLKDDGQRVQQLMQENIVLKERLEEEIRLKEETMKKLERVREELRVQKELNDEK